jgi:trimeric autotransporter adhesin
VAGTPDFEVSAGSGGTSTVAAGKPATYLLSVGGSGGFSGSVALSCSEAPTGATCTISPAMVMVSESTATTATVTVTTTARSEMMTPTSGRDDRWTPWGYGMPHVDAIYAITLALSIGVIVIVGSRQGRGVLWVPVATGVLLLAGLTIGGCGGGSSGSNPSGGSATGTPAGSYTITVTATAGSGANAVSHTTNLTLVVQ